MTQYLTRLWEELQLYSAESEIFTLSAWAILLGAILLILLLNKWIAKTWRNQPLNVLGDRLSETSNLYLSGLVAYGVVLAGVIAILCYFWATGFYDENHFELTHLLSLAFLSAIPIWQLRQWSQLFREGTRQNLYNQPLSKPIERRRLNKAIIIYRKAKFWLLLPALGFLILPLFFIPTYNLISIVLDTSSSMSFASSNGETPLLNGKMALISNVKELAETNDFIITTFSDGTRQPNLNAIVSTTNESKLLGTNIFFTGLEKENLINYINDMEVSIGFSPICETIWKNFLFTRDQSATRPYENVISILVTDGSGDLADDINMGEFLCGNDSYNSFFSDPSNMNIINLSEDLNQPLIVQSLDCGYNIEDGFNSGNYLESLERILGDFKTNWFFIVWIIVVFTISTILALFIKPKLI